MVCTPDWSLLFSQSEVRTAVNYFYLGSYSQKPQKKLHSCTSHVTCRLHLFILMSCKKTSSPRYSILIIQVIFTDWSPDFTLLVLHPQVPIYNVLNKFNGQMEKEYKTHKDSTMRRFVITRLPPFIILFFKVCFFSLVSFELGYFTASLPRALCLRSFCSQRFNKNTFILEKNPTIVNFPVKYVSG